MTIPSSATATGGTTAASSTDATSSVTRTDQLDRDTFLKLLVAQLQYQDPSNPVSSSEFMAQTAQFSQVEKLDTLTSQNASLLAAQRTMAAGSMVGRTVSYTDSTGAARTGTVSSVKIGTDESTATVDGTSVPFGRITDITAASSA